MIGVYTITHPKSGLFYIGSTGNYLQRKWHHENRLRHNIHRNHKLQIAFNQDPCLTWDFNECSTVEEARLLERQLIQGNAHSMDIANHQFVCGHSEETKLKMSKALIGTVHSDATREKMSVTRTGQTKTQEWHNQIMESVRKKVSINGVEYESMTEASRQLGVPLHVVRYRLKSDSNKYAGWINLSV